MSITEYDQLIVVGTSGALLTAPVEPGDLLIRTAPQPGGFYSAVVLSAEAESREALERRGVPVETGGPGTYVEVREVVAGDGPARNVGRRLTDSWGHLPRGQSLLRAVDTPDARTRSARRKT